MKTTLLALSASLFLFNANAQYTQNFESGSTALTNDCWTMTDIHYTTSAQDVITGLGSMYSNPPTGASTRDLITPALVVGSSINISFNYKVSSKINGTATRTIQVGLLDVNNNFTSLALITMDKNTATTVLNFNQTFTTTPGYRKLVIKIGGTTGDGNSRVILDDLYASANPLYGTGTCNGAPVAVNDAFAATVGFSVSGTVITNDSDPNAETFSAYLVTPSPDGTVVLNANGTFTFTPNPGFIGTTTTFTYYLIDNGFSPASSNTATVTINFSSTIGLPVKMLSFTAQLIATNSVDLKWSTATEINASHFVVERSTDGKNFTEVGVVFAAGNSTSVQNYGYNDQISNSNKVVYYRLRQVDADGKMDYSSTRIIRNGKETTDISILTFPNPVTNELRITIPSNWQGKKVNYEVVNVSGQYAKRIAAANSTQTETLNVSSLAPGVYMVKVTCDGQMAQQKIVKQ